jgi:hypothetical protein
MYGVCIKNQGVRPKSRVCAIVLIEEKNLLNKKALNLLDKINDYRNLSMYDAILRKDVDINKIFNFILEIQDLMEGEEL